MKFAELATYSTPRLIWAKMNAARAVVGSRISSEKIRWDRRLILLSAYLGMSSMRDESIVEYQVRLQERLRLPMMNLNKVAYLKSVPDLKSTI